MATSPNRPPTRQPHYILPDAQEIMDDVRQEQHFRAHALPQAIGQAALDQRHEQFQLQANRMDQEQFRDFVAETILEEACAAAEELKAAGEKPDITIDRTQILTPDRKARYRDMRKRRLSILRGKTKAKHVGSIHGWILTPPQDTREHQLPGLSDPRRVSYNDRTGSTRLLYALGENGHIYETKITGPVQRGMELKAVGPYSRLVPANRVVQDQDGNWQYNDQIAENYGHPGGANVNSYVPQPGEDDTSIIHGLGIREAIAALRLRAQGSPQA